MSYKVEAKITKNNRAEIQKMIRGLAGAIVAKHALGSVTALYQIYPVGPDHKDGSPHTRDTFAVVAHEGNAPPSLEGGDVLGSAGQFSGSGKKFEMTKGRKLSFIAAGASFFVEYGTVFVEARPYIRAMIKRAHADITKNLRQLNMSGIR